MASIAFAGGGTAGHIEPALAVARQWMGEHENDRCIFLGTSKGLENTLVPAAGFSIHLIPKVSISRKPSISWLQVPFDLLASVLSSMKALTNVDILIGFGGYVSAPAYIAARLTGTPIVIHEANAKPGWANRLGSFFTQHLAVAQSIDSGRFSDALITGLPLRPDVADAFLASSADWESARGAAKLRLGFPLDRPLVFIMGGSQGSVAINAVVAQSLSTFEELGISVLHSVGKANVLPQQAGNYRPIAYLDGMADAYLAADLIIARSGAVTCSEVRALGRYALFVPLPIGNGEQVVNAASLVRSGRAQSVSQSEFTAVFIKSQIAQLLQNASLTPVQGDDQDIQAAEKITSLAKFAINR